VTERTPLSNLQLTFILTIFLLLCGGLQSACGCLLSGEQAYSQEIRVDSCHPVISQAKLAPCCQSEACHQTTSLQYDLDNPEYHAWHENSHPLIHESRPLTPQLKVGRPFIISCLDLPQFSFTIKVSPTPFQSLYSLRTVVLLN
jgi:hypothetical protein